MKNLFALLFTLAFVGSAAAQISAKVIDSQTGEAISYANISINNSENQVSNDEGFFTISESNSNSEATILVSFFGYAEQKISVGQLKNNQNTVKLQPVVFELNEVKAAERPDPATLMAEVKKNLKRNYGQGSETVKNSLFMRESTIFHPKKADVEITKSTGFTKKGLKDFNKELTDYISRVTAKPPRHYTDMLFNYYAGPGATGNNSKLEMIKAVKLKDVNSSTSIDDVGKSLTSMMLKHIDTTKYYRIKSGWFGSKDTVPMGRELKRKRAKDPKTTHTIVKTDVQTFLSDRELSASNLYDFIKQTDIYEYKYDGAVYLSPEEFAYVLSFKPRKSRANYTGKLYISDTDFAILRADFKLAEGKKLSGFNMKLLLGLKVAENVSQGTLIYKQNPSGEGYSLQYATVETGQYFYVNRPLKLIELTDEDRDVVAFDIKFEGNMRQKTEFLNISRKTVSSDEADKVKEEDFAFQTVKQYDASLWKNSGGIEPLEEMKRYKAEDPIN